MNPSTVFAGWLQHYEPTGHWFCMFEIGPYFYDAVEPTFPLAICRAALKALEAPRDLNFGRPADPARVEP